MSLNKPIWKFKDWIRIEKLNWKFINKNKKAVDYLIENPDKIYWNYLSSNENAIELLVA